jgi:hypothetical protein
MADVAAIQDDVGYSGLLEKDDNVLIFPCMQKAAEFEKVLENKLKRIKRRDHDTDIKKRRLRAYLKRIVPPIAQEFQLDVVTDFDKDHLLTVKTGSFIFVYFGAMNKQLIFVACWLRIPVGNNKQIDETKRPSIFFWVLHGSYAQELDALGSIEGVDMENMKTLLTFPESIEYS